MVRFMGMAKKFVRKRDRNNAIKGDSWFKLAEMNGGDWWAWRAVPEIRNGQAFYPQLRARRQL